MADEYAVMPLSDYEAACDAIREKTGGTDKITSGELAEQISGIVAGGGGFFISDASYLFYYRARLDCMDDILKLIKDCTNMECMFMGCSTSTTLDLSGLDTSNVFNMGGMFNSCNKLQTILFGEGWKTDSLYDTSEMFSSCGALQTIGGIGDWNVSNVGDMQRMFYACSKLLALDLSKWDVSQVGTMYYMFYNCMALTSIGDLNGWDTSSLGEADYMFAGCKSLESIPGFSLVGGTGFRRVFPYGTTSSPAALKKLTFRTDLDDGVHAIQSDIYIPYCLLSRADMVAMFETLPDFNANRASNSQRVASSDELIAFAENFIDNDSNIIFFSDTPNAVTVAGSAAEIVEDGTMTRWFSSGSGSVGNLNLLYPGLAVAGKLIWDEANLQQHVSGLWTEGVQVISKNHAEYTGYASEIYDYGYLYDSDGSMVNIADITYPVAVIEIAPADSASEWIITITGNPCVIESLTLSAESGYTTYKTYESVCKKATTRYKGHDYSAAPVKYQLPGVTDGGTTVTFDGTMSDITQDLFFEYGSISLKFLADTYTVPDDLKLTAADRAIATNKGWTLIG